MAGLCLNRVEDRAACNCARSAHLGGYAGGHGCPNCHDERIEEIGIARQVGGRWRDGTLPNSDVSACLDVGHRGAQSSEFWHSCLRAVAVPAHRNPFDKRRRVAKPSLISGLRSCQTPTGQTHLPGSGSGGVDEPVSPSVRTLDVLLSRRQ
jgi:hypothetical protein